MTLNSTRVRQISGSLPNLLLKSDILLKMHTRAEQYKDDCQLRGQTSSDVINQLFSALNPIVPAKKEGFRFVFLDPKASKNKK